MVWGTCLFSAVQWVSLSFRDVSTFRPSGGNISELFQSGQNASYWYGTFGRPGVFEVKLGHPSYQLCWRWQWVTPDIFERNVLLSWGGVFKRFVGSFEKIECVGEKNPILKKMRRFLTHKFTTHWWRARTWSLGYFWSSLAHSVGCTASLSWRFVGHDLCSREGWETVLYDASANVDGCTAGWAFSEPAGGVLKHELPVLSRCGPWWAYRVGRSTLSWCRGGCQRKVQLASTMFTWNALTRVASALEKIRAHLKIEKSLVVKWHTVGFDGSQLIRIDPLPWDIEFIDPTDSLGGGFRWIFFIPKIGEDEPILTSILFNWVGSITN